MVGQLIQIARELNLMLLDPLTVRITPDDQVPHNDLRITTNVSPDHPEATRQITPLHSTKKGDDISTLKAYLIVDGHREVALQKPLITLGRDLKTTLSWSTLESLVIIPSCANASASGCCLT